MLTPAVTDVLQAQGITPEVANSTVKLVCGILTKGCGEKVYANGCRIAVVDEPGRLVERIVLKREPALVQQVRRRPEAQRGQP